MGFFLDGDTCRADADLNQVQSATFLTFMYPDHFIFPKTAGGLFSEKGIHYKMEDILEIFQQRKWLHTQASLGKGPGRSRWRASSGCPSLQSRTIEDSDNEIQLEKFLNNVLGVISKVCDVSFLRWEAKSHLDRTYARGQPDITCYFGNPSGRNIRGWERVATFCAVGDRNSDTMRVRSFTETAEKTSSLLAEQDGCHLVPSIHILDSSISLTVFDRDGSITTQAYDIHESPGDFLRILAGVSLVNCSSLGSDMSIKWDDIEVGSNDNDKLMSDDTNTESDGKYSRSNKESGRRTSDHRKKRSTITHKRGRLYKIWLRSILGVSGSLRGRGTTVWEGVIDSSASRVDDKLVVVKDSWVDSLGKDTESVIPHILERHNVEGVPRLLAERLLADIRSSDDSHLRVLSRLVSHPAGTVVLNFLSLGELLVAFLDCIIAHRDAFELAHVLHRDISPLNLLLVVTRSQDLKAYEKYLGHLSTQAQLNLHKRIGALTRRGVLADWGYAVSMIPPSAVVSACNPSMPSSETGPVTSDSPARARVEAKALPDSIPTKQVDGGSKTMTIRSSGLTDSHDVVLQTGTDDPKEDSCHTTDPCSLYRTGAWPWLSAELVIADPGQPVLHNAFQDLESFFYVLVGICTLYSEPSKQKSDNGVVECYDLFDASSPDSGVLRIATIQSSLGWSMLIGNQVSPYFQPLVPLLNDLREQIVLPMSIDAEGKFCRRTPFDYDTIIKSIVMVLSSLGPTAWGETVTSAGNQDDLMDIDSSVETTRHHSTLQS